jgi:TonB family protein
MSRSEFNPDDSSPDLTHTLEQHLRSGFPLDLALDLVLNELVVRAAEATRATAAALALLRNNIRGGEMVCRAATGPLAPGLGIPLNARDGLSGACLETRQPQLSVDTEFDPRVDPAISRRLGIRSILIVPVFDSYNHAQNAQFTGVLEVFSASPAAFSHNDQKVLEAFAEECARLRRAAIELSQRPPAAAVVPPDLASPELALPELVLPELVPPQFIPPGFTAAPTAATTPPVRRASYEAWTIALGGLAIFATIAVSFLIGSRIGWLRSAASPAPISQPASLQENCAGTPGCPAEPSAAGNAAAHGNQPSSAKSSAKASTRTPTTPAADELVVYEKGKVIFRMKPALAQPGSTKPNQLKPNQVKPDQVKPNSTRTDSTHQNSNPIVEASSTTKLAPPQSVWLSPAQAETRILNRTEPQYPPEALAAHRSGNVVLEVQVAEDGSVSSIRTLSGDSILAAAASEAVRNWRYQPYRPHDHPAQFQTDVTLSFTLPN